MERRPTVWHSVAASAPAEAPQNANDLAREAVCCNAGLGDRFVVHRLFGKQFGENRKHLLLCCGCDLPQMFDEP